MVRTKRGQRPACSTGTGRPASPVWMTARSVAGTGNTARRDSTSQMAKTVPRLMSRRPVAEWWMR